MVYFLDTNVFLRILVREDEKSFRECKDLLEKVKKLEIEAVTAGIVLTEAGWTLGSYYKISRAAVAEKLEGIVGLGGLKIVDRYDWGRVFKFYGELNVKLVDAVIAAMPEVFKKEWTVVSYDEDFRKLPVKWVKPGEIRKLGKKAPSDAS